jgi:flavorubredoxin
LHGPILKNNINYYLESYDRWSSNQSETKGVVINYCSIYGNTQKVVYELEKLLKQEGYEEVILNDLSECDIHKAISDAFQYPIMILASPTYNNNLFTYMKYFLNGIIERNYHSRIIGLIENGSWNPASNKIIKDILITQKNIKYLKNEITILSSISPLSSPWNSLTPFKAL